uniref:Ig-like domain-containing protein n=1 Tax=Panagrolaimus sp. JU765 TaxID=591449 RepID=A0AC34QGF1_9BILA
MHDAGKYVCNIYNEEYGRVWGNLFVYMRPMFYTNGTTHVKDAEELEDDQYAAIASSVKFSEGDTAILHCPVYGYPTPEVEWYKDGEALDYETGHFEQRKEMLYIHDVGRDDEGLYRCKATNKFPASNNEEEDEFTSVLDQQLRISNSLGWILPLIIIIVIFIILFAIIYFCALCSRRKSDQYDVEKQEKNLRRGEQQKLREQDEEEE